MQRTIKISSYKRRLGRNRHVVRGYTRKHRSLGKRIKYREVGKFQVAFDENGNFRGSKIIPIKPLKITNIRSAKKRFKIRRLKKTMI
jgi:hypothetical protein